MIRTGSGGIPEGVHSFRVRGANSLSPDLKPGSVVRVTVLEALRDGTMRIMIGGRTLTAAGLQDRLPGSVFDARISIADNTVLITPVAREIDAGLPGFFSSLGIPETPVSASLVSFFRSINMRLDSETLRSIMKTASRFRGRELRAAEAAAILVERGIEADDNTVSRMIDLMEGRAGLVNDDGSDNGGSEGAGGERDFCAFVNQKKGRDLHWIVVPFSRNLGGRNCTGSVRFLLDLAGEKTVQTRVTLVDGERSWDFSIEGSACLFTSKPAFASVVFEKLVVYLKRQLTNSGIVTVSWHDPETGEHADIKSVDLEI